MENKIKMTWDTFLDKVYGCWIGKCVSGTIGAPYEGYKGLMSIKYDPILIKDMLPNDDLDLQILWLEVLEKKGTAFTTEDLADIFAEKCPYSPGEYAIFKKNYALGIMPPLSGKYNNNYYLQGMGCPIRSEIWACIAPGDPQLAADCSEKDGIMDHWGESVFAERHMAAMEAMAFTWEGDMKTLVLDSLAYIPDDCRYQKLVRDTVKWCDEYKDWRTVYGMIMRCYGHSDCTNMFQNMGITIMSLLLGNNDMLDTTMMALNCGFDTDCTCATVGSVIGILAGGKALMDQYKFEEQSYKLSVNTTRRSDKVYDLAEDTAKAALLFTELNQNLVITDVPEEMYITPSDVTVKTINAQVIYENDYPVISLDETKKVIIKISAFDAPVSGKLIVTAPDGFTVDPAICEFDATNEEKEYIFTVHLDKNVDVLWEKNIFNVAVVVSDQEVQKLRFGLAGAQLWTVYGPFWENVTEVAAPGAGESYYAGLGGAKTAEESLTKLRQFHINMKAKWEQDYMEDILLGDKTLDDEQKRDPAYVGFPVSIYEDKFSLEDIFAFNAPCVTYMVRDVYAPEDMTLCIQVGHSDKIRIWINGQLFTESETTENWTPENIHKLDVPLKKGANHFVVKLARTNGKSDTSIIFTEKGACTTMINCLGSTNNLK